MMMRDMHDVIVIVISWRQPLCKGAKAVTPHLLNSFWGAFAFHWHWE
jgi:hypothetical protein